jgi:NADPH:quinone reductase-like Zn-dependent oxidoreductase
MSNKAAWLTAAKVKPFKIDDSPMPVPKANEVVIKNRAVAINPTDWAMQALGGIPLPYPYIEGCDTAGEIVAVGSSVQDFKVGDRVLAVMIAYISHNVSNAAFQLFSLAGDNCIAKIPDNISYAEASVLPLAISTAASAIFQQDNLALQLPQINPNPTGKVVLVWGGSSSLGSCAIQLIGAAGYDVAATASSHNLDYCKSLGAKYVFDHAKEGVVEDIITALKGVESAGAFCAIMVPDVIKQCGKVVSELGGSKFVSTVYAPFMPLQDGLPSDVKTSNGKIENSPWWLSNGANIAVSISGWTGSLAE